MANENKGFDGDAFYRALENTVVARSKNWKQVSIETGVSASRWHEWHRGAGLTGKPGGPFRVGGT